MIVFTNIKRFCFYATLILSLFPAASYAQEKFNGKEIRLGMWNGKSVKYVAGEIAIKLRSGASASQLTSIFDQFHSKVRPDFDEFGWGWLSIPDTSDIMAVISTLQKSPAVEVAEPNFATHVHVLPNDPYFNGTSPATYAYQWALRNTGQVPPGGTSGADIDATDAWNFTIGNSNVIIAILDTGIPMLNGSLSHPDLSNTSRIIQGANYGGGSEGVRDLYGHGTHVAGIAAAGTNNSTGIAGIAWNCKILVVRVFDAYGNGSDSTFYYGVHYAVDYVRNNPGCKMVINYSGGGDYPSSAEESAVSYANTYGVTMVASAGNDNGKYVRWPAAYSSSYSNVIAVSATNHNDVIASYSDVGPEINVSAPGGWGKINDGYVSRFDTTGNHGTNIFSTTPNYAFNIQTDPAYPGDPYSTDITQSYGYMAGTSMAAPHVSGTVALLLSIEPSLTPSQVRTTLQSSATKVAGMGGQNFTNQYGYGRLNANAAVRNLYVPQVYTTIASALSAAVNGQTVIVTSGTHSISSNLTGPSGVSITVKSGATINLNGYYLRCTGAGVFNKETGSTINGLAASVQGANGGIYYTIQSAINCTPSGTIQLEARSYGESPSFSSKSNITLAGKGQGSTTIGSVSVTNSSYIGVSNLALSSLSLNNNNQTSIVNVTATSTSLAVDYGGTANTFNAVTANNLAASFGYTSYGGTGAFQPGCHIANGDCGIFLTNSASYTSSNDVFCCNGCDIDATGGAWAYSLNNTYSRPYPQSICGNVTCAGALDWVCGSHCEYRAMEATVSRLAKFSLDSLHDLDVQYLALLTRINNDKVAGKYVLANYLQDFQQLIDAYKTFLKGGSDKEIVKAALSKVRHLCRGMEDLDDFNAYVNVCLASGSFKPVESYFKRYLIWNQVDGRHYANSIALADQIISSSDVDEVLNAEMLYEKGLIYKYYLDDSSKAGQMYASLVSRYPSSPLTRLVEVETMTTPSYASSEPVQDSTRQVENAPVELNNYPNPFNPSTLISYTLHAGGYVSLKVYDALGREVATLVNSNQLPGFHSVTFDGSRSASGVYFYRLTAPGVNQVKKMLLVK